MYIVYAKINDSGYITAVNSSAFLADSSGWTEIARGNGDRFHHAQGNYFHNDIITPGGAYRYKLVNGTAVECTAEEIQAQEEAHVPDPEPADTLEQRVNAVEASVADLTAAIEKGLSL